MSKSDYFDYEPEVAAAMMKTHPQELWLSLEDVDDFISVFGLTKDDLKKGLAAGIVRAQGTRTEFGYKDIHIRVDGLLQWLEQMKAAAKPEAFQLWAEQRADGTRRPKPLVATGQHKPPARR